MKNPPDGCPNYEDCIDVINKEIEKKKNKWTLTSISYMDWSDISQIIRIHIWKKWSMFDCNKPLVPWLSVVISHQIKNLIRNHYSNYSKPCTKCAAAEGSDGCKIYVEQCSSCPLYAEWAKRKQSAQFVKLPVSIDNHINEVSQIIDKPADISESIEAIHRKMKEILKPIEYEVYEGLFIKNEDEKSLAQRLGYISNEQGRNAGYRQIFNIRKMIIEKAKKCIKEEQMDLY